MLTPEQFRELMLDYAYDLLDEGEAAAVRAYIEAHPEAQAQMERVRGLMSKAAKSEFPSVMFRAPTTSELAASRDVAPAANGARVQPAKSRSMTWIRWAVVASVLLIVGGLAYPTISHVSGYVSHDREVKSSLAQLEAEQQAFNRLINDHHARMAQARQERESLKESLVQVESERLEKLRKAQEDERNKQIVMKMTGPAAIQSGAPNEFQITTTYRTGQNAVTDLTVKVRDQEKNVIFEEKEMTSLGQVRFILPPDLPYKPDTKLTFEVTARDTGGKSRSTLTEELSWAAPRYVTHLATDKPMYQPGQTIFFRSLTLNRATMQPPEEDFVLEYSLIGPRGQKLWSMNGETRLRTASERGSRVLLGVDQKPIRGIGAGEFHIPDVYDGGEYTLVVREMRNRFPEEKRKVLVNKYKPDRLFKELDFHRKTYGPGDEVIANCKVSTEAGPVANKEVAAVQVNVDGHPVPAIALGRTDARGWVRIRAVLPKEMDKGVASMTVVFTDGGARESIQKPIPISLKKLFVEFYPEGGEIVPGVPNRVYFQVRNTLDKPAELKGKVVDKAGKVFADVATLHDDIEPGANQGMGVFSFTPEKNGEYTLRIDEPAGIEGTHQLPALQADGIAMQVPTGVTTGKEAIQVVLHTPDKARNLFVGAYCRGRMLAGERVTTRSDAATTVQLKPDDSVGGIVRVTVFEEQPAGDGARKMLTPRAERLVFRKSEPKLNLQIQPDKNRYTPGESAKVSISATDEKGNPKSAIVMVGVVNQQIVTMADEKVYRSLPTHIHFSGEIRRGEELEYADFLLGEHPVSAKALDLLLGVQGWRRFVEQSPGKRNQPADEEVERLLVMTGQTSRHEVESFAYKQKEIEAVYVSKRKELEERLESAILTQTEIEADPKHPEALQQKQAAIADAKRRHAAAVTAMVPFDETHRQLRVAAIPTLAFIAIVAVVAGLAYVAVRGLKNAGPRLILGTAVVAGCVLAIAGLLMIDDGTGRNGSRTALGDRGGAKNAAMDGGLPAPGAAMPEMMMREGAGDNNQARRFDGGAVPPRLAAPDRAMPMPAAPAKPGGPGAPQAMMMRPEKLDAPVDRKGDPKANAPADPAKGPVADGIDKAGLGKGAPNFRKMREENLAERPRGFGDGMEAERRVKGAVARADMDDRYKAKNGVQMEVQKALREVREQAALRMNKEEALNKPAVAAGGIAMPGPPRVGGREFAQAEIAAQPFIVREYAHRPERVGDVRENQIETIYWHPVLVLSSDKKTDISFNLGDDVTRYRILVAGHTLDGRVGESTFQIESRKPFSLEAKLPREMTASDKLDLPVVITNDTDAARSVLVNVVPKNFDLRTGTPDASALLKANARSRRIYRLQPSIVEGEAELRLDGTSEPFGSDSVLKRIPIVPDGYPANHSISDLLEKEAIHQIELPEDFVRGTLRLRAQIYPSTLADLQKGLEGLLREPYGCFEQTSTTNYPNTLILNYLKSSEQGNPDAERRARELLQRGYQRLTSFECEKPGGKGREGYEWFGGQAPPHEALTAYGLLQFNDMAGVFDVDKEMVARTREYLLGRRTGDGSFQRNARALDTFGRAPQHVTNAYIVWALTETGKDNLDKEIDKLLQDHAKSTDPYFLSLLGNALLNCEGAERRARGLELLKKVKEKQAADGGLDGAETSITHSGGRDLRIETTALAILGWLKANSPADFAVPLDKAVRWITQQRGGYGGFGSTQSTILALKALIAHTQANKKPAEAGNLRLHVNGNVVEAKFFEAGEQGEIFIDVKDPERVLKPGKNEVRLTLSTKRPYPYTLGWRYQTLTPVSDEKCSVRLSTKLDKTQVKEGDGVRLTATLENTAAKGQPMTIAIIGLPAGLKVPEDMKQLKDLALLRRVGENEFESGPISFFEIRGRELVLYWRDVKPNAKIEVNVDLIAEIPGEYRGPASRAYLYYTADHKHWVKPLEITISAVEAGQD